MKMKLSLFKGARDGVAKVHDTTWGDFTTSLGPHREFLGEKEQLPAFSPAEFMPGLPRLARNVLRVWFGVLDLDHVSPQKMAQVVRALDGISSVVYSTWSHPKHILSGQWSARVLVQLSRPIEVAEWATFWPALLARFEAPSDPQCKDPGRIYFGAFYPPGTQPQDRHYHVFPGAPLDVSTLAAQSTFAAPVQATDKIPRDRLAALARTWKRSRKEQTAHMGECLARLCNGEPFAEIGNVDNTIFRLVSELVKEWPNAEPGHLAQHFVPSLQRMGPNPHTLEDVQRKIERAQADVSAAAVAIELAALSESKIRIQEAFAHLDPDRDWPYTDAELEEIATATKTPNRDELRKRWIIQRGPMFYILGPGGAYSPPYSEKDALSAVLRDLAPARSAGVELFVETLQGPRRKSLSELMADYGSVAQNYHLDLRAQRSRYDGSSRIFVEAPCPLRALIPTYDPQVDAWLRALAGAYIQDLLNWIALATDLDNTCAALMLTGPKGVGKGLLAHGLSRLWTTSQPTMLEQAMGSFNAPLAKCPLVFADEALPNDFRGHGRTAELREFIAARSRPYTQKYQPDTVMLGASRLIIAANNEGVLNFNEELGPDDIRAIGERIFHLRIARAQVDGEDVGPAETFLKAIDAPSFVKEDRLAKHALWLRDNYPVRREGRFLISAKNDDTIKALSTKGGIRSALCQWLIGYLKNPAPVDALGQFGVRIYQGRLLVRSDTILDQWGIYVTNESVPQLGKLAQAITNLSKGDRPHVTPGRGKPAVHYRAIDTGHLLAWADQTEYATPEEIALALSVDTERRAHHLHAPPGL